MKPRITLISCATKPTITPWRSVLESGGICAACGTQATWQSAVIINDDLSRTWGLSPALRESFDARESMFCPQCGCSFRLRLLADCLADLYKSTTLKQLVSKSQFRKLQVAEINSCGKLHAILSKLPNLRYSEYESKEKGVPSESLEKLSYEDDMFDLVLTSDTLEHVPDVDKALSEIKRVLRQGGRHVFTVPVVWGRKTRNRADNIKGKINNYLEPSYHGAGEPDYLVFNEFGYNIIDTLKKAGFATKVYKANAINLNDVTGVIVTTKV